MAALGVFIWLLRVDSGRSGSERHEWVLSARSSRSHQVRNLPESGHSNTSARFRAASVLNVDLAQKGTEAVVAGESTQHGIRPDRPHRTLIIGSSPI